MSLAILVSAFVSLTLVPMLASRFLTDEAHKKRPSALVRSFERGFKGMLSGYTRTLDLALRHRTFVLVVALLTFVATAYLFITIPKGFFPQEDIGQIRATTEASEDTSFPEMVRLQERVAAIVRDRMCNRHFVTAGAARKIPAACSSTEAARRTRADETGVESCRKDARGPAHGVSAADPETAMGGRKQGAFHTSASVKPLNQDWANKIRTSCGRSTVAT